MATAANAYLEGFGFCPGQGGKLGVVEYIVDATVKPVLASDALNMYLVPSGTRILGYIIRTDKAWTGTVSLGLTGAVTGLASTVTPATTVGDCIASSPTWSGITEVQALTTGKYMVLTTASTNTTGKLTISILMQTMTPVKDS